MRTANTIADSVLSPRYRATTLGMVALVSLFAALLAQSLVAAYLSSFAVAALLTLLGLGIAGRTQARGAALTLLGRGYRRCAQACTIAAMARTPSVNAAEPGCKISGDLISNSWPSRTAGIAAQPGHGHPLGAEALAAP